ncbi:hypothetical protein K1719_046281 [Acacia pycnantha]|nr:hypothetical protein K1719_046281 [Acacia pycnantha]
MWVAGAVQRRDTRVGQHHLSITLVLSNCHSQDWVVPEVELKEEGKRVAAVTVIAQGDSTTTITDVFSVY